PVVGRGGAGSVREADLVALVAERSPGESKQQRRGRADVGGAETRREAVEVVVRPHPGDPAELGGRRDRLAEPGRVPRGEEQLEGEDEVEHLEIGRVPRGRLENLPDEQRVSGGRS